MGCWGLIAFLQLYSSWQSSIKSWSSYGTLALRAQSGVVEAVEFHIEAAYIFQSSCSRASMSMVLHFIAGLMGMRCRNFRLLPISKCQIQIRTPQV
jgi:hypothetical protein